ncbi:hypothetical protein ACKWTF_000728 [Chironomus riparius]
MKGIRDIVDSDELFLFEEKFLGFIGFWPGDKIGIWKLWIFLLFQLVFLIIPQINNMIEAIKCENYLKVISVGPKLLTAIIITLSALSVFVHQEKFKFLIHKIKLDWYKHSSDEYPKWNEYRRRLVKIGNICTTCAICFIHLMSLAFHYSPNIRFFVRFMFHDLDLMDPSIERETILKVK